VVRETLTSLAIELSDRAGSVSNWRGLRELLRVIGCGPVSVGGGGSVLDWLAVGESGVTVVVLRAAVAER
jgi:hypothetical protein